MSSAQFYSRSQIALHWLIAVLIAAAWFTHEGMGKALHDRMEAGTTGISGNTLHVWIGGLVFVLILLRLVLRMMRGAPAPVQGPRALMQASVWGHRMLYILMLAVPALGALAWYGGFEEAGEVHELAGNLLAILALGHAAMALWHHYVRGDGTLFRMMRTRT